MAAIERRDPLLIAARALKTLKRARYTADVHEQHELADALYKIAVQLDTLVGDTAVVRVSEAPPVSRCA